MKHYYNSLVSDVKLDFADVLIEPTFSEIDSRSQVDLDSLPVINANMRSVAVPGVIRSVSSAGGFSSSHRFQGLRSQLSDASAASSKEQHWCTVGVGGSELEHAISFLDEGYPNICLDVAHGAQKQVVEFCRKLTAERPRVELMIGNFGSPLSAARFLDELGFAARNVAFLKLGVGPGSACRTRSVTGVGYPQISLVKETRELLALEKKSVKLVADGGVQTSGDVAKALAAGASVVMTGYLFRNCEESLRVYRGSASAAEYALQGKSERAPEGAETATEAAESADHVVENLRQALRSSFSYVGASNLREFQERARLVRVSQKAKTL